MPDPSPIRLVRALVDAGPPFEAGSEWANIITQIQLALDRASQKFAAGTLTAADVAGLLDLLDAHRGEMSPTGGRIGGLSAWGDWLRDQLRSRLTALSLMGEQWAADALAAATDPWWRQLGG